MELWHLAADTPRFPAHPSGGEKVNLGIGSWPVEAHQEVWIELSVVHPDGSRHDGRVNAVWNRNQGGKSYWYANFGPFADGDHVEYTLFGESPASGRRAGPFSFEVGPKIHLAILFHQHQPLYKLLARKNPRASYRFPWVRLHAIRDYYAMAAMLDEHPEVHLTINLTPVLLWQIEDYTERGATDRALELSRRAAERLSARQREELLGSFFDASWHTQIYVWPRYQELFEKRRRGEAFAAQDLRDLQMWFNLAWFAPEFQQGSVALPDGTPASAQRWIEKGQGFSRSDINEMLEEQLKVMRNVVAIHRSLQDRGQIEVSTTPFFHPILPLLVDSDRATIDRADAVRPTRFSRPQDALAHVHEARDFYAERFGRPPRGMWPAEGAVGQSILSLFTGGGLAWIATDQGVLERSGQFGYDTKDPDVLCQPYRAEDEAGRGVAVFFRDTRLSDAIGFHYQAVDQPENAVPAFVAELKQRLAWRVDDPRNRIACVVLDGENAWGSYPEQGRPFLHALYRALASDPEIRTVTFSEYLAGNPARNIAAHPHESLTKVYDLFHASWIDEAGSAPGNDFGTWIGEAEENHAWDLLRCAGQFLDSVAATPASHPHAFEALRAAEGSDWFWWFGDDQASEADAEFDDLFREHLRAAYRAVGSQPPRELRGHIVPHAPVWTFARPIASIQRGDRLVVRIHCPGQLEWRTGADEVWRSSELVRAGGAIAGVQRFGVMLGPFSLLHRWIEFRFHCAHPGCSGRAPCCAPDVQRVEVEV